MRAWLLAAIVFTPRSCAAGLRIGTEELSGGSRPRRGLLVDAVGVYSGPAPSTDLTTFESNLVFLDQPLVSCAQWQQVAPLPGDSPSCCTLTVADCAERCLSAYHEYAASLDAAADLGLTCTAFQYARQDNTWQNVSEG